MNKPKRRAEGLKETKTDEKVDQWLAAWRFQFNPFGELDAAADLHLHRYLVQHEAFHRLWGDWPTLVFEPQGGGKTALRVRTVQNCFIGQESNRPFALSYLPPFLKWGHVQPTLEQHLRAIVQSGAEQLLLSLAYRPHWFLRLDSQDRSMVCTLLRSQLPGPLEGYLSLITATEQLEVLRKRVRVSPYIRLTPDPTALLALRDQIQQTKTEKKRMATIEQWRLFVAIVLHVIKLDAIYLLIDGLDAVPETAANPQALVRVCDPLWANLLDWQAERVFIKAFLPREAQGMGTLAHPTIDGAVQIANIQWSEELLVEMLVQRLEAATKGEFSTFDAIAAPDLRDVEHQLVRSTSLLPRAVLIATNEMLRSHIRNTGVEGKLTAQDLENGLIVYRTLI